MQVSRQAAVTLGLTMGLWLSLACATAWAADDLAARRAEIAKLQASEQQELLRKQERFQQLPLAEQERLRKFQATLDADQDAPRLQSVLERYHDWLKTLTPSQRARLAELEPQDRVEEIKRIQKQQRSSQERSQRIEVLTRQDMKAVLEWTEDFVWEKRKKLLAEMPKEQRDRVNKMDPQRQRRMLLLRAFERSRHEGNGGLSSLEQQDIDRLKEKLSGPARQALTDASSLSAERRLVGTWIGTAVYRLEAFPISRKQGSLVAEELLQYLQNDVPPPERERLLKMPREQMLEELRAMYFERSRGEFGPGRPWFDGKSPGDRGKSFRGPRPGGGPRPAEPPRRDAPAEAPAEPASPPAEASPVAEQPATEKPTAAETDQPAGNPAATPEAPADAPK